MTKEETIDVIWGKCLQLSVEIEYAKGYEKKYLQGKYDALAELWKQLKGDKEHV